jgi:hypothetical protein
MPSSGGSLGFSPSSSLLESPTSKPTRFWAGIADPDAVFVLGLRPGGARPAAHRMHRIARAIHACTARAPRARYCTAVFLKKYSCNSPWAAKSLIIRP